MQYDPIKQILGRVFNQRPFLRRLFYYFLDWLLLRSWHIRKELRKLKTSTEQNQVIFDAGSGFGQYTYRIVKMFPNSHIIAADVKVEQIYDCNRFFYQIGKSNQVQFQYADLTTYINEEAFDVILSVDVMEHIQNDTAVFRNFYQSMKKGGTLLISTPSDRGGSGVHNNDQETGFVDEHVRDGYSIDEIEQKLKTAGFQTVNSKYTYAWPGNLSWKLSMKYPIRMLGYSKLFFVLLPFYYVITFPVSIVLNYLDVWFTYSTGTGLIVKAQKAK